MWSIELKSTCSNLANLDKGEFQPNGYLLAWANTSSEFNLEPGANQVSRSFSDCIVSGADGQSDEDRQCFFRQREDRFQLQEAPAVPAFFSVSQIEMGRLTLKLLKLAPPYTLAIDRTEWQLGKAWVNVLMLSVSYQRVAIPLFWMVLEEKGCSSDDEKQSLIERFLEEFTADEIRFVSADREFASVKWLRFLAKRKIGFRLRIKANARMTDKYGKPIRASKLCRTLKTDQRAEFRRTRRLWGQSVFVAACRKADGDNVIVISSEQSGQILLEYGERWRIETLFGNLKTRGFRLEDTHLTDGARISKLLSLLTLAGCWALLAGELEIAATPIRIKKHGRAEKSVFRLGFDSLRNCFCRIQTNLGQKQRFQQLTLLLSCT